MFMIQYCNDNIIYVIDVTSSLANAAPRQSGLQAPVSRMKRLWPVQNDLISLARGQSTTMITAGPREADPGNPARLTAQARHAVTI